MLEVPVGRKRIRTGRLCLLMALTILMVLSR